MKKVFAILMVLMTMTFFISAQDQTAPAAGDAAQTADDQAMGTDESAGTADDSMGAGDAAEAPAVETPAESAPAADAATPPAEGTAETGEAPAEGTETAEQPAQSMSVARQKISELIGYNIVNANGEAIGEVKDFIVTMDGKVAYATAQFNEVEAEGDIIVPVKAFTFRSTEGEAQGASLNMDVAQLQGAPVVKDGELDAGYAGQASGFWSGKIEGLDDAQLGSGEGQAYLASELLGYDVVNTEGDGIGNVNDLMVDLDNNEIVYVAMGVGGFLGIGENLFAIPLDELSVNAEDENAVLGVSQELFEDAEGFDKDNWPTEASESWQEDIQSQKAAEQASEESEAVETNPEVPAETTDGTMGSGDAMGTGDATVPPADDTMGAEGDPALDTQDEASGAPAQTDMQQ